VPPLEPGASVLVTGVSSGLGLDLAVRLHDRGHRVIGTVRNAARASETRARLDGRDVPLVLMDQTQADSVVAAMREVSERCDGNLRALVANSGVKVTGPFEALTDADLRAMIEVNVYGTWAVVEEALDLLRADGGGRIVVVGSSSGFTGMPGWSGYAAAKFALELWAESVAYELEPHGVRVTMAEPGTFRSEIYREGSVAPLPDGPSRRIAEVVNEREQRSLASASDAAPVVDRIVRALESPRPPARVPIGRGAQMRHLMRGVVPGSVVQRAFAIRD
jgi:NAD(P)-dependent dehydrogenase (short-subunit alcohol dehydrogenase family)